MMRVAVHLMAVVVVHVMMVMVMHVMHRLFLGHGLFVLRLGDAGGGEGE